MKAHLSLLKNECLSRPLALLTGVVTLGLATEARSDVTAGQSQTNGLEVEVTILGILNTTGQAGSLGAIAPAAYNTSSTAVPVNLDLGTSASIGGIGLVTVDAVNATGVFNSTITSNVNGGTGSRTTTAFSQIAGSGGPFSLTVGDTQALILNPAPLLQLSATAIQSTTSVSGDFGTLSGSGSSVITDFGLRLNGGAVINLTNLLTSAGYSVGADFLANGTIITPNLTVDLSLLGLAGTSLVFNRQVAVGDGISSLEYETTALYLDVNSTLPLVGQALDANIELGKSIASQAAVAPVPEPGSALLFALGIITLLSHRRYSVLKS